MFARLFKYKHLPSNEETIIAFLCIGTAIFFLPFFILLLSSISFALGYPISAGVFIISFLTTLFYCLALSKILLPQQNISYFLYIVLIFSFIIFLSCLISSIFYDVSYDGQWYHQYAIYQLTKGWNPFSNPIEVAEWPVKYYSKGAWIYAASIYKLTNYIEVSKAFNIAFIFGSFLISAAAILSFKKLKFGHALLISLIAVFNPVSIYQIFSFYVDGQLSSLLVALASLLFLSITTKKIVIFAWLIVPIIVLLINVKFTGLVYVSIILLLVSACIFISSKRKREFYKIILPILTGLIIGTLFIGYNPYITNTINYGHPLYPVAGSGARDIVSSNTPKALRDKNRFEKLFLSIFAESPNDFEELLESNYIHLKAPFLFSVKDLVTYRSPDRRIGGFGPLFSGLIVLSTFLLPSLFKLETQARKIFLVSTGILLLSVVANPECWWARFAPQLWLLPVFCITFASLNRDKVSNFLGNSLLIIALINICLVGAVYIGSNIVTTFKLNVFLAEISNPKTSDIILDLGTIAPQIRLEDHHIKYKLVGNDSLPCQNPLQFPYTYGKRKTSYCLITK